MKEKRYTNTRIITSKLSSGKELAIMTDLLFSFSLLKIYNIYITKGGK